MSIEDYMFRTTTRQLMYKSLDASTLRGRAIAQNLANVTTEGYQRKEVRFEEYLQDAMKIKIDGKQTDQDHIAIGREALLKQIRPEVEEANDGTLPGEINNVDVDIEMAKLAENQIQYNYTIKFASFDKYQAAVKGQVY